MYSNIYIGFLVILFVLDKGGYQDAPNKPSKIELKLDSNRDYPFESDLYMEDTIIKNGKETILNQVYHYDLNMHVQKMDPSYVYFENKFKKINLSEKIKNNDRINEISVTTSEIPTDSNERALKRYKQIISLIDTPYYTKYERKLDLYWYRLDKITTRENFDYAYLGDQNFIGYFIKFPHKKVEVGQQWEDTIGREVHGASLEIALTYALKERNNDSATVDVKGKVYDLFGHTYLGEIEGEFQIETKTGLTKVGYSKLNFIVSQKYKGIELVLKIKAEVRIKSKLQ